MNGELKLKRQFFINGGKLREISDIDITTFDEFLQTYLGASADNRLKDIVSTIQVDIYYQGQPSPLLERLEA